MRIVQTRLSGNSMLRGAYIFAALLFVASGAGQVDADGTAVSVTDAHGNRVEVIEDIPAGEGPFAVVIVAPGAGYDMRRPLLSRLARALVNRNIAVIRFDWTYFTADPVHGHASVDLSAEVINMQAAVSLARSDPRLDASRMVVAGKSLGSIVSFNVLRADPVVLGGLLLTPLCALPSPSQATGHLTTEVYPNFAAERRPLALIAGDDDAYCPSPALYALAASNPNRVRVAEVGGDHGFEAKAGPGKTSGTDRNLDLAIANAVDFVEEATGATRK